MEVFWLVLTIFLIIIEALTINLVSIWFVIGSVASLISTYFTNNIFIQVIIFIVVSIISLLISRPIIKKFNKREKVSTNIDMYIGMDGIVEKDITKNENGRVKVKSRSFLATSKEEIKKGEEVTVLKIEGVKLIVKKKEE